MEDVIFPSTPNEMNRVGSDDSGSFAGTAPSQTPPGSPSPEHPLVKAHNHLEPPLAIENNITTTVLAPRQDVAPAPSTTTDPRSKISGLLSHSPIRPLKTRALSSSSSVLARFTSRSSSQQAETIVEPVSPTSIDSSGDSPLRSKLDRASLAKPKGKYKSGVNWENSPINLTSGDEPFLVQAAPLERTDEEIQIALKAAEMEAMAAAGSTKAALAWARANSFGDPIFANHRRVLADASAQQTVASSMSTTSPTSQSSGRSKPVHTRSAIDNGKASIVRFNSVDVNGNTTEAVVEEPMQDEHGAIEGNEPAIDGEGMMAEAVQQVLFSAKNAAANADGVIGFANEDPISSTATNEAPKEESRSKAKMPKRKTFLGFGGFKKSKGEATLPDFTGEQIEQDLIPERPEDLAPPRPDFEPISTVGRRRRFNDTRQLNLLASELAAEALLGAPDSYATLPPEARRASMMNLLAASNGDMAASPANASQVSLHANGIGSYSNLPVPQAAFINDYGRSSPQAGSSSQPSSPPLNQNDRFEPPRAPFARSIHSVSSTPSSPILSNKAKLTGLPSDMLTGLGDGPYPTLPPRGLEIPEAAYGNSSQSDASWDQNSAVSRGSLPDSFVRSRGASASSTPLPKKSVLQMTMYNPEMELQGLTKPPKSSKSTPFGSRSNSKQVTPVGSFTNMKEKYNASAPASILGQKLRDATGGSGVMVDANSKGVEGERTSAEGISDAGGHIENGKKEKLTSKLVSRRSFFSRKSEKIADGQETTPTPPLPSNTASQNNMHLSPSPNITAAGSESPHSLGRNSAASRSAQSLVKVPSPTISNTNTSASSQDPNAFTYSSDGNSQQHNRSALTTPEAMPMKSDTTLQTSSLQSKTPQSSATQQATFLPPALQPSTPQLAKLQPSPLPPNGKASPSPRIATRPLVANNQTPPSPKTATHSLAGARNGVPPAQIRAAAVRPPPPPPAASTPRPSGPPSRPLQQQHPNNQQMRTPRAANQRNASSNSKAGSIGNAAKLNKFKSMFAHKVTAVQPEVTSRQRPVNAAPVKDYSRNKGFNEKTNAVRQNPPPMPASVMMRKGDSQHSTGQSSGKDGSIYSNSSIGNLLRKSGWSKEKVVS